MIKLTNITSQGSHDTRFLVTDGSRNPLGLISKIKDTRTERHPWKAFHGVGFVTRMVGAFYGPDAKQRATQAVERADKGENYETIRESLSAKSHRVVFRVAARSSNTNSFGLRQYILITSDGKALSVLRSAYSSDGDWPTGKEVVLPLPGADDFVNAVACLGCECVEQISPATDFVIREVWGS